MAHPLLLLIAALNVMEEDASSTIVEVSRWTLVFSRQHSRRELHDHSLLIRSQAKFVLDPALLTLSNSSFISNGGDDIILIQPGPSSTIAPVETTTERAMHPPTAMASFSKTMQAALHLMPIFARLRLPPLQVR